MGNKVIGKKGETHESMGVPMSSPNNVSDKNVGIQTDHESAPSATAFSISASER